MYWNLLNCMENMMYTVRVHAEFPVALLSKLIPVACKLGFDVTWSLNERGP